MNPFYFSLVLTAINLCMALSSDYYGTVLNGSRNKPESLHCNPMLLAKACSECLFLISENTEQVVFLNSQLHRKLLVNKSVATVSFPTAL